MNIHDFKTYTGESKDIYENTPISGAVQNFSTFGEQF